MRRTRKQPYYYITDYGGYDYTVDNGSNVDKQRHKIGNYFTADEVRQQLKIVEKKGFINWIKELLR